MNCCDQNCHQGKDCPIRQGYGHRKVRAGQPVRDNAGCLPVDYTQAQLDVWKAEESAKTRADRALRLLVAVYIAAIFICIAALAVWGHA